MLLRPYAEFQEGTTMGKSGQCVYCGETKLLTKDHVIPKCLFPAPLPSIMVTVPVCDECNNEKSKHDDYLRDMLVVDAESAESSEAQTLVSGKVTRSASKNLSAVIRAAKEKGKFEAVHSPGGIYLGHGYTFPLEGERVNHIFSLMVRGLYYKLTGLYLPQDCKFDVRRLTSPEFSEYWEMLKKIGYNGPYRLGNDVFTCIFIYAAEEPAVSQWWLWFYNSICVFVTTAPANYDVETLTPTTT
jgi:hypothetical protein